MVLNYKHCPPIIHLSYLLHSFIHTNCRIYEMEIYKKTNREYLFLLFVENLGTFFGRSIFHFNMENFFLDFDCLFFFPFFFLFFLDYKYTHRPSTHLTYVAFFIHTDCWIWNKDEEKKNNIKIKLISES